MEIKMEKQLDVALSYFYENLQVDNKDKAIENLTAYYEKVLHIKIGEPVIKITIKKLETDGFIESFDDGWRMTVNGYLFEGYAQKKKDIKAERYRTNLFNVIGTVGTGLAGLYALVQILEYFFSLFCHCHQ